MTKIIPGLKLIYQTGRVNVPDDPSMPYKLVVSLSPPEFMLFTFVGMHGGSEELVVRSETRTGLDELIERNQLSTHSRLQSLTITGPNGVELELLKKSEETTSDS